MTSIIPLLEQTIISLSKQFREHKLWTNGAALTKLPTNEFFLSFVILAHTQRLVHIQSMLKRAPSYRTLELELIEWQERELFEYFVVVSLKKKPSKNTFVPEVTYQFPKVRILLVGLSDY